MRSGRGHGCGNRSDALWGRGGRHAAAIVARRRCRARACGDGCGGHEGRRPRLLGVRHPGPRPDDCVHPGFARERDPAEPAAEVRRHRRGRPEAPGRQPDPRQRERVEERAARRYSTAPTRSGPTQIHKTYRSIDGLHASLSGLQITFLAKLPYVAAIVPNDAVEMSSLDSTALSNTQLWPWVIGAPADWSCRGDTAADADDRRRRLGHRRQPRATSAGACSARST